MSGYLKLSLPILGVVMGLTTQACATPADMNHCGIAGAKAVDGGIMVRIDERRAPDLTIVYADLSLSTYYRDNQSRQMVLRNSVGDIVPSAGGLRLSLRDNVFGTIGWYNCQVTVIEKAGRLVLRERLIDNVPPDAATTGIRGDFEIIVVPE